MKTHQLLLKAIFCFNSTFYVWIISISSLFLHKYKVTNVRKSLLCSNKNFNKWNVCGYSFLVTWLFNSKSSNQTKCFRISVVISNLSMNQRENIIHILNLISFVLITNLDIGVDFSNSSSECHEFYSILSFLNQCRSKRKTDSSAWNPYVFIIIYILNWIFAAVKFEQMQLNLKHHSSSKHHHFDSINNFN